MGRLWNLGALRFYGKNYVDIQDSDSPDLTTAGTIEFWVKKKTPKVYQMYVSKYGPGATSRKAMKHCNQRKNIDGHAIMGYIEVVIIV